jgi:hypothetical protein
MWQTLNNQNAAKRFQNNAELARISKRLVTLCAIPFPSLFPVQQLVAGNQDKLAAFLEFQGFKSLLARVGVKSAPHPLDQPPP